MAVSMISGARDTTSILAGSKKVDMGDLHQLEDNRMMLMKLVSKIAKKPTINSTFNWMTDELKPKFDLLNDATDMNSSDTSMVVDNGGYWRINDIVKVPRTGECCLVTNVSSDTLTVTRDISSTHSGTILDNEQLINLGPAYNEGATLQAASSTKPVLQAAYTQIFRHSYHLTGTEKAMGESGGLYGGSDVTLQRTKKAIEHGRDINLSFYWNVSSSTSLRRTVGGINDFIPTANKNSVASLTETEFNSGLKDAFRYGSEKKVMLCSRKVAGIVNEYMGNMQRVSPGDSKFGVKMVDYQSPHGEISIATDHAIEGTYPDGYAFVLDLVDCKYRYLQGRDTVLLLDRQAVDEDGVKEEYLTECGAEWGEGRHHYAFTGVTS